MNQAGDAYIYYTSPVSGKQKYHIGTMDLDNKYIQAKPGFKVSKKSGSVRVFCWDLDDFKNIDINSVQSIVPLNVVLGNA